MSAIPIILGAELRSLRNQLFKRSGIRIAVIAVVAGIAAVTIGGASFAAGAGIGHYLPTAEDPILTGAFTALSVLMLLIGFPTVIATLFVGRDLLQLVLAPVRTFDVFAARLALAVSANAFISAILLAAVLGLGAGANAAPAYYVLAVFLVLVQILLVTSVQALLMSLVLQVVPARLARDVAAGLAGLTGAGLYLTWNIALRRDFTRGSYPDLSNLTRLTQRIDLLPSAWPGHALSAALAGNIGTSALWSGLAVGVTAVTLSAAALLYSRTVLAGLGVFGSTPVMWRRRRPAPHAPSTRAGLGAGSPTAAIARKDWLAVRRDVRRLTRLVPAMLFPIGYAFALSQPARNVGGFWTNVFLVTFMSMFMATALATPAIPSERRGFLLLRMAPLTMQQILRAKVLLTLPPILIITTVFAAVVATVGAGSAVQVLELCLFVVWLSVGFVVVGVSAGGVDPKFDAVDDRRGVGLVGSLTSLVGSLAFGLASLGALALFIFGADFLGSGNGFGALMIAGGVVVAAATALVPVMLMVFSARRLNAFEAPIAET
jgi:ABC-2 type transport system permease protein